MPLDEPAFDFSPEEKIDQIKNADAREARDEIPNDVPPRISEPCFEVSPHLFEGLHHQSFRGNRFWVASFIGRGRKT
jgi:hypothetical protein